MPDNSGSRKPFEFGKLIRLAYLVVFLVAFSWAKEFLLPIILAMLISFLLTPVVSRLERLGFHSVLATLSVVAIAFVFIGALCATLSMEALDLINSLPQYRSNISAKFAAVQQGPPGPLNEALRNIGELTKDLAKTTASFGGAEQPEATKVQIVSRDSLVALVKNSMTPVIGPVAEFAVVLVLVVFFLLERKQLRGRFLRLIGHSKMATTTLAVDEAGSRLSRFLLMQLAVNSAYALVLGTGLYLIGIPNAILWAVLALVLRFLPYVGLWIAASFPLILSIAISTSWTPPILTLLLYVVLEVVTNNVVEPVVLGGSTGISPLAVIVSALFWTWLWGPLGLLLATPVTACLATLGRYFSAFHPYSVMLATDPPTLSETRLVRLLTEDRLPEAKALIHELTAMHLSIETADELIVPAVRTIENELFPGSSALLSRSAAYLSDMDVASQNKTRIYEQIRELIEELTVLTPSKSDKPAKPLRPSLSGCVIVPFVGEADEVVGRLLARLLESEGIDADLISWRTLRAKKVQRLKELGARLILLSAIESRSVTGIGKMVESIKILLPDAVIMIGLWSLPPEGAARLIKKIRASEDGGVYTSLGEAVRGIVSFATTGRQEVAPKAPDRLYPGFSEPIKLQRQATSDAAVKIKDLVKTYLDNRGNPTFTAVKNINLDIKDGEFMVLVGPSGCGKSTTLRLIAGLEGVTSGTISIGGQVVNHLEPKDRGIAMVFQGYALYPHMNIFENMAFTLQQTKQSKEFISAMVGETAKALHLDQMMHRKPQTLSGGQQQRVALARAIVRDPKVFLFDEPLSNLDAKMRVQMRSEISRLHDELGTTTIYVTHDQIEAMTMGDRICVMRDGVIMQVADPLTLYSKPENRFVASFIGSPPMNLLKGKVHQRDGGLNFVENGEKNALTVPLKGRLQTSASKYVDKEIVFGIRPENISNKSKKGSGSQVTLTVEISEPMGSESLVYLKSGTGYLIARIPGENRFQTNEQMTVELNLDKVALFDPETEQVIR
jgi:multiple sugar transport system ATP-binding protein